MKKILFTALLGVLFTGSYAQVSIKCGSVTYSIPGELVATLKHGTMELKSYAAIKNDSVMFAHVVHMDGKLSSIKTYRMAIVTIDAVASNIKEADTGYSGNPKAFWLTFNKPMFGGTLGSIYTEADGCGFETSKPRLTKQGYAMTYFESEAKAKEFMQKVFAKGAELLKPKE